MLSAHPASDRFSVISDAQNVYLVNSEIHVDQRNITHQSQPSICGNSYHMYFQGDESLTMNQIFEKSPTG